MSNNLVIDGNLALGGTFSASGNVTVSGTITNSGTENFTGTASFNTAGNVYFTATTLTLTGANVSSAIVSACTLNTRAGKITTTALTAAAASTWSLLVTNSVVSTSDIIVVGVTNGTATQAVGPDLVSKTVTAGGAMLINFATNSALNGTLVIDFVIFK